MRAKLPSKISCDRSNAASNSSEACVLRRTALCPATIERCRSIALRPRVTLVLSGCVTLFPCIHIALTAILCWQDRDTSAMTKASREAGLIAIREGGELSSPKVLRSFYRSSCLSIIESGVADAGSVTEPVTRFAVDGLTRNCHGRRLCDFDHDGSGGFSGLLFIRLAARMRRSWFCLRSVRPQAWRWSPSAPERLATFLCASGKSAADRGGTRRKAPHGAGRVRWNAGR